jgi:hypothetical protein
VSVRLSKAMMRAQDAIDAVFDSLGPEEHALADELVLEHLPPVLRELTGDINNALAAFSPYKMYGATDNLLATTEKTFYDSFLKG